MKLKLKGMLTMIIIFLFIPWLDFRDGHTF